MRFLLLARVLVELDTVEVTPCIFYQVARGVALVLSCADPTFMVLH